MNRRRSSSINRRRSTKLAEDTILNRHQGAICLVSQVNQYYTSKVGGYYKD